MPLGFELGVLDLFQLVLSEFDVRGGDVLCQPVWLGRAWDGDDPRLLREGARRARSGQALRPCAARSRPRSSTRRGCLGVPPAGSGGSWRESRVLELGALVDRSGEKALAERAERDEADAELLQRREYLLLGLAPPERVLALQRRDRLDGVGAADCLRAGFGEPEVRTLPWRSGP